jgi:hypothetical protein
LIEDKEFLLREIESEPKDIRKFYQVILISNILTQIKINEINKEIIETHLENILSLSKWDWDYEVLFKCIEKSKLFITDVFITKMKENINLPSYYRQEAYKILSVYEAKNKPIHHLIEITKEENIYLGFRKRLAQSLFYFEISDNKIIDNLIGLVKNENIDYHVKEELSKSLSNINDNNIIDTLIRLVRNENIDYHIRMELAQSLSSLKISDNEIIDNLLKVIRDKNINYHVRKELAQTLSSYKISDDKTINNFIEIIRDIDDDDIHIDIARCLINTCLIKNINNKEIINILIEYILNKYNDDLIRAEIIELLIPLGMKNDKILNTFINLIEENKYSKYIFTISNEQDNDNTYILGIYKFLVNFIYDDLRIHGIIMDFLENKNISIFDRYIILNNLIKMGVKGNYLIDVIMFFMKSKDFSSFNKIKLAESLYRINKNNHSIEWMIELITDENISYEIREHIAISLSKIKNCNLLEKIDIAEQFQAIFRVNLSIECIFKAYDKEMICYVYLLSNASHQKQPLYIKNNRYCTIYKNKEIQTRREIKL